MANARSYTSNFFPSSRTTKTSSRVGVRSSQEALLDDPPPLVCVCVCEKETGSKRHVPWVPCPCGPVGPVGPANGGTVISDAVCNLRVHI